MSTYTPNGGSAGSNYTECLNTGERTITSSTFDLAFNDSRLNSQSVLAVNDFVTVLLKDATTLYTSTTALLVVLISVDAKTAKAPF